MAGGEDRRNGTGQMNQWRAGPGCTHDEKEVFDIGSCWALLGPGCSNGWALLGPVGALLGPVGATELYSVLPSEVLWLTSKPLRPPRV